MAIAYDNATTSTGSAAFNHTCGAAATLLIVAVTYRGTMTITGITYDGVAMSQAAVQDSGTTLHTYVYYLSSPGTGAAKSVAVTWSSAPGITVKAAVSYSGTRTSGVLGATASGIGSSSTSISQALTTTVSESIVFASVAGFNTTGLATWTATAGYTERWDGNTSSGSNYLSTSGGEQLTTGFGAYTETGTSTRTETNLIAVCCEFYPPKLTRDIIGPGVIPWAR